MAEQSDVKNETGRAYEEKVAREQIFWEWGITQGCLEASRRNVERSINDVINDLENLLDNLPSTGLRAYQEIRRYIVVLRQIQLNFRQPFAAIYEEMEEVFSTRYIKRLTIQKMVDSRIRENRKKEKESGDQV